MKASFNYTGRRKLNNDTFDLKIQETLDNPSSIQVKLHKDKISDISDHSTVWLEAYRGPRIMRFGLGQLSKQTCICKFILSDFGPMEPILFRLKIIDEKDELHPIKAWRDKIRPVSLLESEKRNKCILPVYPCDLKNLAWKIDWSEPTRPVLQVNSRINTVRDVTSIVKNDPDFAALVFPEVLRDVLSRLIDQEPEIDEDDENEWMIFGERLAGYKFEDSDNVDDTKILRDTWIDDVIQNFGDRINLMPRYIKFKDEA
ncbi:MAG TPA: hypothetical protein DET40_18275 [Lentisphaeria bacterium]|nr:MAG: hypothetical protein A2X45_14415 [Lentisphaerae bacterium GWF2_50_93]HCE45491.1 hypothetical protein [Lentisphaeria bacterium]